MLNDAEQADSKADVCSVLARDAQAVPMRCYKYLCSIGCGSKEAREEIIGGTWHDRLERNQRTSSVDPTANLSAGWGNVIYFPYLVS